MSPPRSSFSLLRISFACYFWQCAHLEFGMARRHLFAVHHELAQLSTPNHELARRQEKHVPPTGLLAAIRQCENGDGAVFVRVRERKRERERERVREVAPSHTLADSQERLSLCVSVQALASSASLCSADTTDAAWRAERICSQGCEGAVPGRHTFGEGGDNQSATFGSCCSSVNGLYFFFEKERDGKGNS